MTILITGGAGFIGSHLADRLLTAGHRVVCLDNFDDFYARDIKEEHIREQLLHSNYQLAAGDIRDSELLSRLFKDHRFEVVYHIAARVGVRPSLLHPQLYEDVNIKGTLNLLECVKEFPVKHFVFASSSSVYGINSKIPFSESDPIELPISPYAASKRACELFCYTYHHLYKIPTSCLRFFTVYGPRQRPEMAIHRFTRAIDQGEPVTLFGDGTTRRDYTYVGDIVEALVTLADQSFGFEIFNIGNSQVVELRQLVALIEKCLNKKANIIWKPEQPGDVPVTYSDISKAQKMFGYQPATNIEDGIKKFVEWYTGH